jgi:CBS domain-containing protein
MVEHDRGEILVVDTADCPLGIITDRDIVRRVVAKGKNPLAYAAATCMSRPVITVHGDVPLDQILSLMTQHQTRGVIVVDESGACLGILTQAHIASGGSPEPPRQRM